jgi:hypothetical protein
MPDEMSQVQGVIAQAGLYPLASVIKRFQHAADVLGAGLEA